MKKGLFSNKPHFFVLAFDTWYKTRKQWILYLVLAPRAKHNYRHFSGSVRPANGLFQVDPTPEKDLPFSH
jgi:hypothetical protein